MEDLLFDQNKQQRMSGKRVGGRWIRAVAKMILRENLIQVWQWVSKQAPVGCPRF